MAERPSVCIVGAGAIGSYVGACLAAGGHEVHMLMRRPLEAPRVFTDLEGKRIDPAGRLHFHHEGHAPLLSSCAVAAVAVKSKDTDTAAAQLASQLAAGTPVLSLQNGLDNAHRLQAHGLRALHGVVTFNVFVDGARYQQTTSGPLFIEASPALPEPFDSVARRGGLDFRRSPSIDALARGKLILNLNNGVCAAAGVSIARSVQTRELRRCYAACIREALAVFEARGEAVERLGKLAPRLIATVLPWPDAIVRVLARPMVRIDPSARSSTLVDLEAGRRTEIDELNGDIVRLGEEAGVPTPANRIIRDWVHRLEGMYPELVHPSAATLWAELRTA